MLLLDSSRLTKRVAFIKMKKLCVSRSFPHRPTDAQVGLELERLEMTVFNNFVFVKSTYVLVYVFLRLAIAAFYVCGLMVQQNFNFDWWIDSELRLTMKQDFFVVRILWTRWILLGALHCCF